MDIEHHRKLPARQAAAEVKVRTKRLFPLGVIAASCVGFWGGMPAIANVSSLNDAAQPSAQVTADDVALACGVFPVDAYVEHGSATLKRSFCELLAFAPLTFSNIDSFIRAIVPDSLTTIHEPSPERMTLPSFWWSRNSIPRQFGSYRLVDSWTAYEIRASAIQVIDVQINPQIWRILQYPERYGALNHLAEEARAHQYNLRLFSGNQRAPSLIGLYICDFLTSNAAGPAHPQALDTASGSECIALVDEDSISRMQAKLEPTEESIQPAQVPQPEESSVIEANAQREATQP
jgi:hypothetical protein